MPHVDTNGIVTFYEDAGQGPPVVLVHGHSADLRLWDLQVPALSEAGYRVIRYDVRGHGRSSVPPSGYTWQNYALDLHDLLDRIAVPRAHVAGLSMGGGIALQFALDFPERVSSLVLVDSTLPGFDYSPEYGGAIEELVAAVRAEGPRAAFERLWLTHPLFDGVRRFPERFELLQTMALAYAAADYLDETPHAPPERQAVDRLGPSVGRPVGPELRAPTLVMVGELDIPDFQIIAEVLAGNIAGARLQVIADSGHVPPLEQPQAFNQALLEFLAAVPTSA
ncbi:MAG TPA: alpha/beta fold hydrolase [Dehalococcoidia bacterium]|nr:alpha/beta fold hydrolase [Dehalococcoidia bacterium]